MPVPGRVTLPIAPRGVTYGSVTVSGTNESTLLSVGPNNKAVVTWMMFANGGASDSTVYIKTDNSATQHFKTKVVDGGAVAINLFGAEFEMSSWGEDLKVKQDTATSMYVSFGYYLLES